MAVPGFRIGHWQNESAATGCTVVICPPGTRGSGEVRGGAPGTREASLLPPLHLVKEVDAVLLTGGSAFGLSAADGVMQWLEESGRGFVTPGGRVPIVPAAVLYDLEIGEKLGIRPDKDAGYAACSNAKEGDPERGSVGAGCGATIGKYLGAGKATKGGVGWAEATLAAATMSAGVAAGAETVTIVTVSALVAVNSFGDVIDRDGTVIAGPRLEDGSIARTSDLLVGGSPPKPGAPAPNTTLAVIMTDAGLSKEDLSWVARMSHDGLSRSIDPVHSLWDGDTIFSLSTGTEPADPTGQLAQRIGVAAAHVLAEAVRDAVHSATPLAGIPSAR